MKRVIGTFTIVVLVTGVCLLWVPVASAQTDEEAKVTEAFLNWVAARNAADVDTLAQSWTRPASAFYVGSLLVEWDLSTDELRGLIQNEFDSGREDNLWTHHLDVKVYGDAALVTCYLSGTVKTDEGTIFRGPWLTSAMWVKDGGKWKLIHVHYSILAGGPPSVLAGEVED